MKLKVVYEHLKENGDVRLADSAPKSDLKQGEIDIKALQQKRQHAELTRFFWVSLFEVTVRNSFFRNYPIVHMAGAAGSCVERRA